MSKRIKTLITTLVMIIALSTTAFAVPINTVNTFDGFRGADVVTQVDGTETQYYQDYFGTIFNNLPSITKTVVQGEKGNTLKYSVNAITNPSSGGADVEHHIEESEAYVTLNNIERESGFGALRLVYSTQPVTVTFNNTKGFGVKSVLKARNYVMDNGNLAYTELGNDQSQYLVNAVAQLGVSSFEIKEPGLYVVQLQNAYAGNGLTELVYIAKTGESITNIATSNIAVPTTLNFIVNGNNTSVPTYSLNGSNYIRVRDLAYILNGTSRQVGISQNGGTDTTSINTVTTLDNQSGGYKVVGGELSALPSYTMTAETSVHNLAKNGSKITPSMYTIGGQDFVSLKALASILSLDMQGYSNSIVIDTSKTNVSASTAIILVNSAENSTQYANHLASAKFLGYPIIDIANKSKEQIESELSQIQGLKKVYVFALPSKQVLEIEKPLYSKYTVN